MHNYWVKSHFFTGTFFSSHVNLVQAYILYAFDPIINSAIWMLVKEGDLVRLDSEEKAEKLIFLSIFW